MKSIDLAIVGAGLSGSRVLIEIARTLLQGEIPSSPFRIALFDKLGEFGRGVPYGSATDRHCMLIETVEQTRCPDFRQWLLTQPQRLHALEHSTHPHDRTWYARNAPQIRRGEFDTLFVPRHLFGDFNAAQLEAYAASLEAQGFIHLESHATEVANCVPDKMGGYRISTADDRHFDARVVVISVGSIPRKDRYWPALQLSHSHRYLTDQQYCGSFRLTSTLDGFSSAVPDGPIEVAVIGGAASAIESVHTILTHPHIGPRVRHVTTLSRSGLLPCGLRAPEAEDAAISPWAWHRTSAQDYVDVVRQALEQGNMSIRVAMVEAVVAHGERMSLSFTTPTGLQRLQADLVVNCTGAGDLRTTPSLLLRNLSKQLELRENDRGFKLADEYMLKQWPGVYVAGPLLNQNSLASHVESISAVFRVAMELGPRVVNAMKASRAMSDVPSYAL